MPRKRLDSQWTQNDDGSISPHDGEPVNTDELSNTGTASTGQHISGAHRATSQRTLGTLPTQWTDHGEILAPSNIANHITFPTIINAEQCFSNPLGKYYMYYASYRDATGIQLAYSDSIESGWTEYSNNPLFGTALHSDLNNDIASPWPVYDPVSGNLWVYFHSRDGSGNPNQFTAMAYSSDGVSGWTYDGKCLNLPLQSAWDSHERAYLRVYRYADACIGFYQGRESATDGGHAQVGFAWSYTGRAGDWYTSDRPLFEGDHPNFDSTAPGIEKASMFHINGTPYLLAYSESDDNYKVGPWLGWEHTSHESFRNTNLTQGGAHDGYNDFATADRLYLTGPSQNDPTNIQLWSSPWGDML